MNDFITLLLAIILSTELFWMLLASILFSFLHSYEELMGEGGPLWINFGDIVGVRIPDALGFLLFTVLLPLTLAVLAWVGYWQGSVTALSLLFGARVGDTLISHWGLRLTGLSNPNPGIMTTPLYVLEALVICLTVTVMPVYALIGAGFFAAVLPTLWLVGLLVPRWRL